MSKLLLSHDHFLDERLTVDLESVQVDTRRHVIAGLRIFSIPVRLVLAARQQLILYRLAPSDASTALQNRHSYLLGQQIVNPQTYAVLTTRICTSLSVSDDERDSGVLIDRVGKVLSQLLQPGALSSAGLGS